MHEQGRLANGLIREKVAGHGTAYHVVCSVLRRTAYDTAFLGPTLFQRNRTYNHEPSALRRRASCSAVYDPGRSTADHLDAQTLFRLT
jgi:hypothetical protein